VGSDSAEKVKRKDCEEVVDFRSMYPANRNWPQKRRRKLVIVAGVCCCDFIGVSNKNYQFMLTKQRIALLHECHNMSCDYWGHKVYRVGDHEKLYSYRKVTDIRNSYYEIKHKRHI
jgi:hypothetical protein